MLTQSLGWERIATGDLLRAARREGTALGEKARAYMDAGNLVPDELIVEMVREHLAGLSPSVGIIFDGFPRTLPQAESLDRVLPGVGRQVDAVLLLEAEEDVLVKRISGRRVCQESGRVYNVYFDPPRVPGRCDESGAELVHRADDQEDTVRHRLKVYEELTEPLVAYYESGAAPILRVDGAAGMEAVKETIRGVLTSTLGLES